MLNIGEILDFLKKNNFTPEALVIPESLNNFAKELKDKLLHLQIINNFEASLFNKFNSALCIADFSLVKSHEETTNLNFEDYLKFRQGSADEPLDSLYNASLALKEDAEIIFFSPEPITHKENVKKVLICSKFKDIEFISNNIIKAKKIKLIKYEFDKGRLVLEQAQHPDLIEEILEFSEKYYKSLGFNYRREIDRLFVKHSDYFAGYRKNTREILAVARFVLYLPHHFLPLMLATEVSSNNHLVLSQPNKNNYGEFSAIYTNSFSGGKAYKECIKNIFKYVVNLNLKGIAFTTYLENDNKTEKLYKEVFGFKTFVTKLVYGDFKGVWFLLKEDRQVIIDNMISKFIEK